MSRKKVSTTIYLDPTQDERLKALNRATKVPVAEYIRQAIEAFLVKKGMPATQPEADEGAG